MMSPGTLDVVRAVADHQHAFGQRTQLVPRRGSAHRISMRAPHRDSPRRSHRNGRRARSVRGCAGRWVRPWRWRPPSGRPHAPGRRAGSGCRSNTPVHRPPAAEVVGPIGGDRRVGQVAEAHRLQRVMHRGAGAARRASSACHGGPAISAPTSRSACRKLATMPSAESVSVPSKSKMTNSGRLPAALTCPLSTVVSW